MFLLVGLLVYFHQTIMDMYEGPQGASPPKNGLSVPYPLYMVKMIEHQHFINLEVPLVMLLAQYT